MRSPIWINDVHGVLLDIEADELPCLPDDLLHAAAGHEVGEDEGDGDLLAQPLAQHGLQPGQQLAVVQGEGGAQPLVHLLLDEGLQQRAVGEHLETCSREESGVVSTW